MVRKRYTKLVEHDLKLLREDQVIIVPYFSNKSPCYCHKVTIFSANANSKHTGVVSVTARFTNSFHSKPFFPSKKKNKMAHLVQSSQPCPFFL